MYREYIGENYNHNMELKEVAALVKKQVKEKYKGIKVSARTKNHGSVTITLKLSGDEYKAKQYSELCDRDKRKVINALDVGCIDHSLDKITDYLSKRKFLSKKAIEIEKYTEELLESYNYDRSDVYRDYFDKAFCGFVKVEFI